MIKLPVSIDVGKQMPMAELFNGGGNPSMITSGIAEFIMTHLYHRIQKATFNDTHVLKNVPQYTY